MDVGELSAMKPEPSAKSRGIETNIPAATLPRPLQHHAFQERNEEALSCVDCENNIAGIVRCRNAKARSRLRAFSLPSVGLAGTLPLCL